MPDATSAIIAQAADDALRPLGLRRRGRSRVWIDDRGWWLINVEFQPSMGRQGSYLNVGHQHLWIERDHFVFVQPDRPLGGSRFVAFDGDEDSFRAAMADVAQVGAKAVEGRRSDHGEGAFALERIAGSADDLEAGVALALLGRASDARARLSGQIHEAYSDQVARYREVDSLTAAAIARHAVATTRMNLKLPDQWDDWSA